MDEGGAAKIYIIKVMDSISNTIYSLFSTFDQNVVWNAYQGFAGQCFLPLTNHYNDVLESRMRGKDLDAMPKHRCTADLPVLLGNVATRAGSRPCGNDDRG